MGSKQELAAGGLWQVALITISSRIVGSAFRCLETFNPQLQASNAGSDPKTVCMREMSTIAMAFGLALLTGNKLKPWAEKRNWSGNSFQFVTTVVSTAIAETIGRLIAYYKLYSDRKKNVSRPNQPMLMSWGQGLPNRLPGGSLQGIQNIPTSYGMSIYNSGARWPVPGYGSFRGKI